MSSSPYQQPLPSPYYKTQAASSSGGDVHYVPTPNVSNVDQEYPVLPGVYGALPGALPQWQQPGETDPKMFDRSSSSSSSFSSSLQQNKNDDFETWLSSNRYEAVKNQSVPFRVLDLEPINALVLPLIATERVPDALAYAFVSPQNSYQIHRLLSLFIADRLRTPLYLQPLQELADLMAGAYNGYLQQRTGNIEFDLKRLNLNVLNAAAPQVLSAMRQHAVWIRNFDQVATPMDRPTDDPYKKERDDGRNTRDLTGRYEELSKVYNERDKQRYASFQNKQK